MNGVGLSVLARQMDQWNEYISRKKYVADVSKPKCILVDIDGTLANHDGIRSPYEWDKVHLDTVHEHVKMIVNNLPDDISVIIMSGRDSVCRLATGEWLIDNEIYHNDLFMRTEGDMRDDREVKLEIFWRDIAPNYNCQFVIDDRPKIIRAWQEIGLKTFIVGNPYIEF